MAVGFLFPTASAVSGISPENRKPMNDTLLVTIAGPPTPEPYVDLPKARDYIVELGRVYLEAGLPLAAAFDAALADYQNLGTPADCDE